MTITDQIGQVHHLQKRPVRIVSLVPSITELLHDLGLQEQILGVTKFCVHPKGFKKNEKVTIIGGTKSVHLDRVKALQPDIIFANKEENTKEDVESLQNVCPVWVSNIAVLGDAHDMIRAIGEIFMISDDADQIITKLKSHFPIAPQNIRVAYLIWRNPYMTIGGDTFIHSMLDMCGYYNVFAGNKRYPEVDVTEIKKMDVDCIFLSSEPFPFKKKHIKELVKLIPNIPIHLVDGEYFSWYGTRQLHLPDYLEKLHLEVTKRT